MPRRKIPMELIASQKKRAATLSRRLEGFKKKAEELSILCGVRVAIVCGADGAAPPVVWESEEGVLNAYRALPDAARAAHTFRAYADAELGKEAAKLARVRQGGPAALSCWDKALEGLDAEEARRVLEDVDAAIAAAEDRRVALGLPALLDDSGGLFDVVAPLSHAVRTFGGGNFVDVEESALGAQGLGGGDANGGRYEQAVWTNDVRAAAMQPSYGFHQYPAGGGGANMDGYQLQMAAGMNGYQRQMAADLNGYQLPSDLNDYQLQMASDLNGYSDNNDTRIISWDGIQPCSGGLPHLGYASQCYGGMSGYRTQHVSSTGGRQPNLYNAVVPAGYPSFDIGHGYIDTPVGNNAQSYAGNFVNAPPALSHTMGTGDNFSNAAPAQSPAVYHGGELINGSSYTTQQPAAQQQIHCATSSQQSLSGIEQLHYFSDVEDAQLQFWGN